MGAFPEWIRPVARDMKAHQAIVGVAIGVSDVNTGQLHVGLVSADEGRPVTLLHLASHFWAKLDLLPDVDMNLFWCPLEQELDRLEAIAGLCRSIAERTKRGQYLPYGLVYRGGQVRHVRGSGAQRRRARSYLRNLRFGRS